ncbi:MAG: tyrosine-type recombinase/integrase [Anaerolineales bacterium]|nr:tyrosine-type recombinase/integrase [Anaerolineales bacterium]
MLAEIERFLNWLRRRNGTAHTWQDYQCDLQQFAAAVGDHPPQAITFHDVDQFVMQQAQRGMGPSTINRRLAAIQSLYAFLSDEDPALVCPVLPHRHGLPEPKRLPRPVQTEQLEKFFAVITDVRDRAMFILMLRCGLRRAEVAGLQLVDLYLQEERPRLVARGKGGKERSVYLSPQAERALRAYLAERRQVASEFVFLSYQGRGLSTTAIHYRLMRYREQAGVSLTAHRLRHTFANDLVSVDVPVTTIQKLLGHAWLDTTQTYVAANDRQVQADYFAASKKLEGWQHPPSGDPPTGHGPRRALAPGGAP